MRGSSNRTYVLVRLAAIRPSCRLQSRCWKSQWDMAETPPNPDEVRRDRRALETILGFKVDAEAWPDEAPSPGCRVRVNRDSSWNGPWAAVFTGTIDATRPPRLIRNPSARAGEFDYFVQFDTPQYDSAGDGPFRKAQIWVATWSLSEARPRRVISGRSFPASISRATSFG